MATLKCKIIPRMKLSIFCVFNTLISIVVLEGIVSFICFFKHQWCITLFCIFLLRCYEPSVV